MPKLSRQPLKTYSLNKKIRDDYKNVSSRMSDILVLNDQENHLVEREKIDKSNHKESCHFRNIIIETPSEDISNKKKCHINHAQYKVRP